MKKYIFYYILKFYNYVLYNKIEKYKITKQDLSKNVHSRCQVTKVMWQQKVIKLWEIKKNCSKLAAVLPLLSVQQSRINLWIWTSWALLFLGYKPWCHTDRHVDFMTSTVNLSSTVQKFSQYSWASWCLTALSAQTGYIALCPLQEINPIINLL